MLATRRWDEGDNTSATTATKVTTPAKQWRRRQRDKGVESTNKDVDTSGTLVKTPVQCRQQRQCNKDNASATTVTMPARCWRQHGCDKGDDTNATTAATQQQQQRQQNDGIDARAMRAMTPAECWQRCPRNAGGDTGAMSVTMPAQQWQQRADGDNAGELMAYRHPLSCPCFTKHQLPSLLPVDGWLLHSPPTQNVSSFHLLDLF
jgi:hypothetical protein